MPTLSGQEQATCRPTSRAGTRRRKCSCDSEAKEYPLSLMLDVFQSIQKKDIPFMLVLVGLPTLFPKLVEARTFAERMFHVVFLDRLTGSDSRFAILKPIQDAKCPVKTISSAER